MAQYAVPIRLSWTGTVMANFRAVHTKFWADHKVEPLSKGDKLLFLYLLTNPYRTSSGLYPITRNRAAQDCSMTVEEVDSALEELAGAGLTLYDDETSTVLVLNAVKYLQRTKQMRTSVVNDVTYINSPLAEELVNLHQLRQWEEWTDEAEFALSSRKAIEDWKEDETPF